MWNCSVPGLLCENHPAKQECNNGDYDENYHQPFCNFHRETGDPSCSEYVEYQCQYKEYYGEPNQTDHFLLTSLVIQPSPPYLLFLFILFVSSQNLTAIQENPMRYVSLITGRGAR